MFFLRLWKTRLTRCPVVSAVLERPSAGDSGGVVVVAPTFGADVSPALRIPRPAGTKTLRVPRYDVNEVAAVARLLAASGLIEEQPSAPVSWAGRAAPPPCRQPMLGACRMTGVLRSTLALAVAAPHDITSFLGCAAPPCRCSGAPWR